MSTSLNPLVDKIRAAHPGAYDDMSDAELTMNVLKKYPQYADLAVPHAPVPNVNMKQSAAPQYVRAATSALPAVGGMVAGALTAPAEAAPGPGTAVNIGSAALGAAGGEQARLLANRAIFGKDETSPISKQGLKSTAVQGAIAGGTTAALSGMGALANRSSQASYDPQEINQAIGAQQKSVRIGKGASDLGDAATMPGRGLAKVGFSADELKNMTPPEQMAAVAPHWKQAGQAVDKAITDATNSGATVDVTPMDVFKRIQNPTLQEKMIDEFNGLSQELGIGNQRAATPAEARALRQALSAGARYSPAGDLSSLGQIRDALRSSVSAKLSDAVPGLSDIDQHYSDLRSAMDAIQKSTIKYAIKAAPAPDPTLLQKAGKSIIKNVVPIAAGAIGGGGAAYKILKGVTGP